MNIKPLFDRILVKKLEPESVTVSGIVLANADKEKSRSAVVVAVGNGEVVDGKTLPMVVKVGDKVLFPEYAGNNFHIDGEDLVILSQKDVLAIVED